MITIEQTIRANYPLDEILAFRESGYAEQLLTELAERKEPPQEFLQPRPDRRQIIFVLLRFRETGRPGPFSRLTPCVPGEERDF